MLAFAVALIGGVANDVSCQLSNGRFDDVAVGDEVVSLRTAQ